MLEHRSQPPRRSLTECPGATQNAQELHRMPRSYTSCSGATQNAQELHRMPRSYTACPGATQNAQELHSMPRSYTECPGATQPVQELHSFLGLIHYNQNFLHNLSTMLALLHELTRQHVKWKWGLSQKKVFEEAKALLSSSKMLVHYNPELPIIVSNGASPYGIGSVLSHHLSDGCKKPIAYASQTISSCEKSMHNWRRKHWHLSMESTNSTSRGRLC